MKLAGVSAAAWHAARLLAFLAFAAAAGTLLLRVLDRAAGRHIRAADGAGRFNVGAEALAAAFTPCQVGASRAGTRAGGRPCGGGMRLATQLPAVSRRAC